jgi:SMODS and SLOG-associating 2TM effector domain 1
VNPRTDQLLGFYREHRINDQLGFYTRRRALYDRAANQALALSAILLGFTTAVAALTGAHIGAAWLWAILATVLPAASTALTSYSSLYAFEQQSKIYGDAARAGRAAARPVADRPVADRPVADPDLASRSVEEDAVELVRRVEAVFRQEQAQWGQLTSQVEIRDETKA